MTLVYDGVLLLLDITALLQTGLALHEEFHSGLFGDDHLALGHQLGEQNGDTAQRAELTAVQNIALMCGDEIAVAADGGAAVGAHQNEQSVLYLTAQIAQGIHDVGVADGVGGDGMTVTNLLQLIEVLAAKLIGHHVGRAGQSHIDEGRILHSFHVVVAEGLLIALHGVGFGSEAESAGGGVCLAAVQGFHGAVVGVAVDHLTQTGALGERVIHRHQRANLQFGVQQLGQFCFQNGIFVNGIH